MSHQTLHPEQSQWQSQLTPVKSGRVQSLGLRGGLWDSDSVEPWAESLCSNLSVWNPYGTGTHILACIGFMIGLSMPAC